GCGPSGKVVPVSGVVMLNGKPAEDVAVTFQPIPPDGINALGPSASGITGPDGRYTLKVMGEELRGATVGKNTVSVFAYVPNDPHADRPPKAKAKSNVPARYRSDARIEFDVPPKGTTTADFDLKSP